MKRLLSILLVLVMVITVFGACAKKPAENNTTEKQKENNGKLKIITTIFPPYDFAKNIVSDMADVTMLLPLGSESHSFEPTTQDIVAIQNCDVFICIGGESEKWVEKVMDSLDTEKVKVISLLDLVDAKEEEVVEGMEAEEEEEGGAKVEYDEHVWTSPVNAERITKSICDAICEKDEANAKEYQYNALTYIARLEKLDSDYREMVSSAKRDRIVVADRFPFRYLCDEYNIKYSAAFAGCSASTDPSANTVKYLINKVNEEKIPVIFYIEFSQKTVANTVLQSTDAKAMELHSCHNVSAEDFNNGVGYIELMTRNLDALREALN
ncbi:MAG: zinc ABC transporter substrate-binding protein [Clostridia bacterium]|nr:zinc ABC transporter substrate-binding protein [Clostridia bacterium]